MGAGELQRIMHRTKNRKERAPALASSKRHEEPINMNHTADS